MDGLTQVFYTTAAIQPGVNHIKIAIADAGDWVLDSNVMIACGSFTCVAAPPTGACCFDDTLCVTLSYENCVGQGGNYYGDYIPCEPNPCDEPVGACCFEEGECEIEGQLGCEMNGGIYQGDGTDCDPNPCLTSAVGSEFGSVSSPRVGPVPSPSTGEVAIRYRLSGTSTVGVVIFDSSGRQVRHLTDGSRPAGNYSLKWDGRDDSGNELPPGVYHTRVETAAGVTKGKVILIR
jgi:hypothetical protein